MKKITILQVLFFPNRGIFGLIILLIFFCSCSFLCDKNNSSINQINISYDTLFPGGVNTIRNKLLNIENSDSLNRNVIFLRNGTYNEIDINSRDYVTLCGESKDSCIIICDGNSNNSAFEVFGWRKGFLRKISDINRNDIHALWIHHNFRLENLTVHAERAKYCIHMDAPGKYNAEIVDCIFLGNDVFRLVGIGSRGGQNQKFVNCNFMMTDNYALGWHNWNNQDESSSIKISDCLFHGAGIRIDELGSNQKDSVRIENCYSEKPLSIFYSLTAGFFYNNGELETNPVKIPYCISIIVRGCNKVEISNYMRPEVNIHTIIE